MTQGTSHISLHFFCWQLHHYCRKEGWDGSPRKWGDRVHPWLAVVQQIEARSGIMASDAEAYIRACGEQKKPDTYTARELHRWWNHEGGHELLTEFSQIYPEVSKAMSLPTRPSSAVGSLHRTVSEQQAGPSYDQDWLSSLPSFLLLVRQLSSDTKGHPIVSQAERETLLAAASAAHRDLDYAGLGRAEGMVHAPTVFIFDALQDVVQLLQSNMGRPVAFPRSRSDYEDFVLEAIRFAAPGKADPSASIETLRVNKPEVGQWSTWQPPKGYVGRKTVCSHQRFRKKDKNPPPTTIDVWVKAAERDGWTVRRIRNPQSGALPADPSNGLDKKELLILYAPDSGESFFPECWIRDRIQRWHPRT